jgi:hypothetical protein
LIHRLGLIAGEAVIADKGEFLLLARFLPFHGLYVTDTGGWSQVIILLRGRLSVLSSHLTRTRPKPEGRLIGGSPARTTG